MYEDYAFVLEWNELPNDLQIAKVNNFIAIQFETDPESFGGRELDEILEDDGVRADTVSVISAHFPIYF